MSEKLPTEHMVVAGFEAVSMFHETDGYKAMSGCRGAAESAKVCWAAMVAAMPEGETPRQDRAPSDAEILAVYKDCFWMTDMNEDVGRIKFAREVLARYGKGDK